MKYLGIENGVSLMMGKRYSKQVVTKEVAKKTRWIQLSGLYFVMFWDYILYVLPEYDGKF
jgi:hypothetical protein